MEIRKTTQFLAPLQVKPTEASKYDIYPTFPMPSGSIRVGLDVMVGEIGAVSTLLIDGYVGVFWDEIARQVIAAYQAMGVKVNLIMTHDYMKSSSEVDSMTAPYLNGDDLVFGRITDLDIRDWFTPSFFDLSTTAFQSDAVNVVVGCGASLVSGDATLVYVDLPKNELQFRMRAGSIRNLGSTEIFSGKEAYKRLFFVDWVVLNNHKCDILPAVDYMVDGQQVQTPTFASGDALRAAVKEMSKNFLRVRPWFEPGAWGGTWMRDNISQLNPDVPNLAWSFELMSLENGLLFSSDDYILEVTFDTLMFLEYENVLGKCAQRFKYDFPIRYDFLDTFDGGNLSVQCHPRTEYIKSEFGMPFTQDETYYILDCKNDPQVYLGFQEGVDPCEFEKALYWSQNESQSLDIEQYVQKHAAKKHDLFLIPNGTIHGSGKDNMVLEISSAPYIFTFKMYDWMRVDLDGKPRPINIDRGMKNLYFERQGEAVTRDLICKPVVLQDDKHCKVEHLPTHDVHFYDVHRYTFDDRITITTGDHANVLMIVEGGSVVVETQNGMSQRFNYAETFIIPAAAGSYTLSNESSTPVTIVETRVKESHC